MESEQRRFEFEIHFTCSGPEASVDGGTLSRDWRQPPMWVSSLVDTWTSTARAAPSFDMKRDTSWAQWA